MRLFSQQIFTLRDRQKQIFLILYFHGDLFSIISSGLQNYNLLPTWMLEEGKEWGISLPVASVVTAHSRWWQCNSHPWLWDDWVTHPCLKNKRQSSFCLFFFDTPSPQLSQTLTAASLLGTTVPKMPCLASGWLTTQLKKQLKGGDGEILFAREAFQPLSNLTAMPKDMGELSQASPSGKFPPVLNCFREQSQDRNNCD